MHPIVWVMVGACVVIALAWGGLSILRAWLDGLRGVDDYNGGPDW